MEITDDLNARAYHILVTAGPDAWDQNCPYLVIYVEGDVIVELWPCTGFEAVRIVMNQDKRAAWVFGRRAGKIIGSFRPAE